MDIKGVTVHYKTEYRIKQKKNKTVVGVTNLLRHRPNCKGHHVGFTGQTCRLKSTLCSLLMLNFGLKKIMSGYACYYLRHVEG